MQWIVVLLHMMIMPLCLNTMAMGEVFFCHLYWISSFLIITFISLILYETNERSIWSIRYVVCLMWSSIIFHTNVIFCSSLNILFIDWFYFWFWDRKYISHLGLSVNWDILPITMAWLVEEVCLFGSYDVLHGNIMSSPCCCYDLCCECDCFVVFSNIKATIPSVFWIDYSW